MLRSLRNFPWKQAPLVVIGFLVSLINRPANERGLDDRKHYGKMREGLMRRKSRP